MKAFVEVDRTEETILTFDDMVLNDDDLFVVRGGNTGFAKGTGCDCTSRRGAGCDCGPKPPNFTGYGCSCKNLGRRRRFLCILSRDAIQTN